MKTAICILLKIIQLIACVAAVITKKISDKHSERVYTRNKKFSTEWILLNSIAWSKDADEFSTLTFVGYTFITSVLLVTRFVQKNANYHTCENIFLCLGVLFFTIVGLLILSTVEQLPDDILHYAFVLGGLSFFCAILFLLDLLFFKTNNKGFKNAIAQTDMFSAISSPKLSTVEETICCRPHDSSSLGQTIKKHEKRYLRTDL
ncbi:uncharacterized protein LOC115631293 [Scaptodrosophila lebanonensis]|uniref:Uncharacterized protein LOC115631293 n=1 Tax=Drosophila lebanonensis TaxID=7225 RepID=A0A6J2U7F7_DROLE|nr:uncharacterized protein LOC115631293 [Scaptodrosophila lebanonensis]